MVHFMNKFSMKLYNVDFDALCTPHNNQKSNSPISLRVFVEVVNVGLPNDVSIKTCNRRVVSNNCT